MRRIVGALLIMLIMAVMPVGAAHADANNFRFSSLDSDYYLGTDKEGRSTLKTVERLTAEFPTSDQNHGIERAIPTSYDGHTVSLHIDDVTDGSGKKLTYETYGENSNKVIRIGDADTYVHGRQTYVLTYTQHDVTKYFSDTNDNEFYWDINGTEWSQPFGVVTARIHLADTIMPTFTKKIGCYYGVSGSTDQCQVTVDGNVVTATAANLGARQTMTVAVGFTPGTFRGYEPSTWDRIVSLWLVSLVVTSILGVIAIFWPVFRYKAKSDRTSELPPIPVEYIPPKGYSILSSAQIGDDTKAETTAIIIDLAVRHYITIAQTKGKGLFHQAEYELAIVKAIDDLSEEEKGFVAALFGATSVGSTLQTKTLKNNYSLYRQLQKNGEELKKRIKGAYGLRQKSASESKTYYRIGTALLILSVVTVSPLLLIAALTAYICGATLYPLTDAGLDLRRYLAGLKRYIEAAEKDRLAMLQSPEGAEKTGVKLKGDDDTKIIRLYERVLPYAVLFGQEKEWNKQLALRYENAGGSPDWYMGHSAFNAAVFTSALNDFSDSMNSYGASTSSSSGGSGGGGSAGGGGGGGGGGGW